MTLELALILGFIFHLVGDYLLQNDWMATNKTKCNVAAKIHALCYSLLFLTILPIIPWLIVLWTHFFIDRFRLAVYWIKLVNWNFKSKNFGYSDDKPMWMSVWLMIIIDNVFHVVINSLTIIVYYKFGF